MSKKGSLAEAMLTKPEVTKTRKTGVSKKKKPETQKLETSVRPPSRQGKKNVSAWVDPDVIKQIKQIGIDEDKTSQDLLAEALNGLFAKYRKAQIA